MHRKDFNFTNEELEDPHFYVEMFENDVLIDTVQYDMENPHLVENMMLEYEFSKNKTYEMVLNVKIRDRFYPIAKSFFTTGVIMISDNSAVYFSATRFTESISKFLKLSNFVCS